MWPSWVSEPIGLPMPLRIASTPAMNVVATAPIPGMRMPSLPLAGLTSTPFLRAIDADLAPRLDGFQANKSGTVGYRPGVENSPLSDRRQRAGEDLAHGGRQATEITLDPAGLGRVLVV